MTFCGRARVALETGFFLSGDRAGEAVSGKSGAPPLERGSVKGASNISTVLQERREAGKITVLTLIMLMIGYV